MKFIYVLHISYTHSLKVILCNILNKYMNKTKAHGIEFSTWDIILVLECKAFLSLDFHIRLLMSHCFW